MDLSSLSGIDLQSAYQTPTISSTLTSETDGMLVDKRNGNVAFGAALQSAMDMVNEANAYSNAAEEEEIKYALGQTNSIHELQIAQQKANVSLQYTVAVRDAFMSAYKEIIAMQF